MSRPRTAPDDRGGRRQALVRRWLALFVLAEATWTILSWTRTAEQITFGVILSALVATACLPLGGVVGLWTALDPRRAVALGRLAGLVVVDMVRANVLLSRRIWTPSLPVRPGMLVVGTEMRTEGGLTADGVLTSLIVDNQLVDLDLGSEQLQYHAVWVASEDPAANRDRINGPVEDWVGHLEAP